MGIKDYLAVDSTSKTGLRWIKNRGTRGKAGQEAFTRIGYDGYYGGSFNYTSYSAHQVIMYLIHNEWSNRLKHVDHIDGNKLNNNINNLRFVSPTGNQRNDNRKLSSNNTSGIKGLHLWTDGYNNTYWRAKVANKVKVSKDKQVCIDWLDRTRKNDPQYINAK